MKNYTLNNLPTGWTWRTTPGHGYLIPTREANQNVPAFIRSNEYEEDCEYSIAICFNTDLFTEETVKRCMETFKNWFPDEYQKAFKVVLQPGESSLKDSYYFERQKNVGKYEKRTGYGSWCYQVPPGYVYAILREILPTDANYKVSTATGKEITGLIKDEVYNQQDSFDLCQVIPFKRDETYYTWESYTKATGAESYNILELSHIN